MVVLQPREVNSTCIHASVLHESIIKYMWFQIRKNHIFCTVAVCSISLSLSIYIIRKMLIQKHTHTHMNILSTVNTHGCSVLVSTASLAERHDFPPVEAHYLKSTTSQRSQVGESWGSAEKEWR